MLEIDILFAWHIIDFSFALKFDDIQATTMPIATFNKGDLRKVVNEPPQVVRSQSKSLGRLGQQLPVSLRDQCPHDKVLNEKALAADFESRLGKAMRSLDDVDNDFPVPGGCDAERLFDLSRVHCGVELLGPLFTMLSHVDDIHYGQSAGAPRPSSVMTAISLSHNPLGDNGTIRIVEFLLTPKVPLMNLNCLDFFGVGLTDDGLSQLLTTIESSRSSLAITKLKVGDNFVTSKGLALLSAGLHTSLSRLQQLHVGGNPIGGAGLASLAAALLSAPHSLVNIGLRDLVVPSTTPAGQGSNKGLDCVSLQSGFKELLSAIAAPMNCKASCAFLRELQLRGNPLGDDAVFELAKGFLRCASQEESSAPLSMLSTLDLSFCGASNAPLQALFDAMNIAKATPSTVLDGKSELSVRELLLGGNSLALSACVALGSTLVSHTTQGQNKPLCFAPITTLNLASCNIDAPHLTSMLREYSKATYSPLATLVLSGNAFDASGAAAFVSIIAAADFSADSRSPHHHNPAPPSFGNLRRLSLASLVLQNCSIDHSAATILFDGLAKYPCRLRVLEMQQNCCGDLSVPALCRMVDGNKVLAKMVMQDNCISAHAMREVERSVLANTSLRSVSLGGQSTNANALSNTARVALARHCDSNKQRWIRLRNSEADARHRQPTDCSFFSSSQNGSLSGAPQVTHFSQPLLASIWEVRDLFASVRSF